MYARKIDESNQLNKEIEKLLELCDKYDEENDGEYSFFDKPVSEEEMLKWEQDNGTRIPESYKEWLRFTGRCRIAENTASFWLPDDFHPKFVPEDLVVIGELIGDGELVCFSKINRKLLFIFEGKNKEVDDFDQILKRIINILDDKSPFTKEEYELFMAELREEARKGLL